MRAKNRRFYVGMKRHAIGVVIGAVVIVILMSIATSLTPGPQFDRSASSFAGGCQSPSSGTQDSDAGATSSELAYDPEQPTAIQPDKPSVWLEDQSPKPIYSPEPLPSLYLPEGWFFGENEFYGLQDLFVAYEGLQPIEYLNNYSGSELQNAWENLLRTVDIAEGELRMLAVHLRELAEHENRGELIEGLRVLDEWITAHPEAQIGVRQLLGARARAINVPLEVINDQVATRTGEIVTGGVVLPAGGVRETDCLALYEVDSAGSETRVPAQFHPLGMSYRDGSVRWVLVQAIAPATLGAATVNGGFVPNDLVNGLAANITPARSSYRLRSLLDCSAAPSPIAVSVTRSGQTVSINTGPLQASFRLDSFQLPNTLAVDGVSLIQSTGQTIDAIRHRLPDSELDRLQRTAGTASEEAALTSYGLGLGGELEQRFPGIATVESGPFGGPVEATIEERGPLRTSERSVRTRRNSGSALAEGDLGYVIRVFAYAGGRTLRIEYTTISHDVIVLRGVWPSNISSGSSDPRATRAIPSTRQIRQWELNFQTAFRPSDVRFGFFNPRTAPTTQTGTIDVVTVGATAPSSLEQILPDVSTANMVARISGPGAPTEPRTHNTAHAVGYIDLQGSDGRNLVFATKNFWQEFPKSLAFNPTNGTITFGIWPRSSRLPQILAGGRARTYEFAIGANTNAQAVSASVRAPLRITPTPGYASRVERDYPFVPANEAAHSILQRHLDHHLHLRTLAIALYGDANYGDIAGDAYPPHWSAIERAGTSRMPQLLDGGIRLLWNEAAAPFNNYRAAGLSSLLHDRALGAPHAFRIGESMVVHSLDRDTGYYSPPMGSHPRCQGTATTPFYCWPAGGREQYNGRPLDHLSLASEAPNIYQWYQDIAYYYLLTGNRRVLDAIHAMIAHGSLTRRLAPNSPAEITGRHHTLALSAALAIWNVVGSEAHTVAFEPQSFTGYPASRTDACGSMTPAGETPPATARCTTSDSETLFRNIQIALTSLIANVDWTPRPFDWNGRTIVPGRYILGGFTTTYAVEAFFRYYELTRAEPARNAVRDSADYFYMTFGLPSGSLSYSRQPSGAGQSWAREDYHVTWGQNYSPGALGYLVSDDTQFIARAWTTASWLFDYDRIGEGPGTTNDIWAPAVLFAARATGREFRDHRPPIDVAMIRSLEARALDPSSYNNGPWGTEVSGWPGYSVNAQGGRASGPYTAASVTNMRCGFALDALRLWIETGNATEARRWAERTRGLTSCHPLADHFMRLRVGEL